jgi:hypothetical protein
VFDWSFGDDLLAPEHRIARRNQSILFPLRSHLTFSDPRIGASASADIASNKDDNTQSDTNNTSNSSNGGIDAEIEKYVLFTSLSLLGVDTWFPHSQV